MGLSDSPCFTFVSQREVPGFLICTLTLWWYMECGRELPEGPLSIPESCSALGGPPVPQPSIRLPAQQLLRCPLPPFILSPAPGSRHSLACQSSPLPTHTLSTPGYPHSQLLPETSHFRVCHTSLQFPTIRHKRDVLVIILPPLPLVLFRVLCCGFRLPLLPPLSPSTSPGLGWPSLSIRSSSC